jgi:hypothetical protein
MKTAGQGSEYTGKSVQLIARIALRKPKSGWWQKVLASAATLVPVLAIECYITARDEGS